LSININAVELFIQNQEKPVVRYVPMWF